MQIRAIATKIERRGGPKFIADEPAAAREGGTMSVASIL